MGFLRKIFGATNTPQPMQSTIPDSRADELITGFDEFGREIKITRQDWLENVLKGNLEKFWENSDELAGLIISALRDGFFSEIENAALQLHKIDTDPSRGHTLLGIVYLQTERPQMAETLLKSYISKYGEEGVVLTNLAKAEAAQGRHQEAMDTLWKALLADPNQDNGLDWYISELNERGGDELVKEGLSNVAEIPGSWRSQLWLARYAMDACDLAKALALYNEAIEHAEKPIPIDLLTQMSGDLGNQGHLMELIQLTAPHFDAKIHGLQIGNNLIKGYMDTGQLEAAYEIIKVLQLEQRPDWKEHLGYWEAEMSKAKSEIVNPIPVDELKVGLLSVKGPVWHKEEGPFTPLIPTKSNDAMHVVFVGSSFEGPNVPNEVTQQPTDNPGRMSRALPLFLSEYVFLESDLHTTVLVPWITNDGGGFALMGKPQTVEAVAEQARNLTSNESAIRTADYAVNTHLITRGENWTVRMQLIRTIDGKELQTKTYDFAEAAFHLVSNEVLADLNEWLGGDVGGRFDPSDNSISREEVDHYLLRQEQTLAVRCSVMDGVPQGFLSNASEILTGMIHLSLQNPKSVPSRMLLMRCLSAMNEVDQDLVASLKAKVEALSAEAPLDEFTNELIAQELANLYSQ